MGHCRKNMISILLTNQCNLSCTYCYLAERKQTVKNVIDLNFVRRGIDDFFKVNKFPGVRFFAEGEPTLAFDEMVNITEYAIKKSDGKAIIELQTNGVFSESKAVWIAGNMNIVYISMDGPPEINDVVRNNTLGGGSSETIIRNIKILKQNPNLQVGIRATISSINNGKQKQMIEFFNDLGIKIVFGDLIFCGVGSTENSSAVSYTRFIDKFVEAREYADKLGVFYSTMFAVNFDEEVKYACRSCLPTPHLTVDGYVTCCDMCVSGDSILKDLIYGKYDSINDRIIYFPKAVRKIRSRKAENINACKDCEVKSYCGGGCLGEALNETGDFYGVKTEACNSIRYLWQKLGANPISLPFLHP